MADKALCSIPDCGKLAKCRGWCVMHHARWRRTGDPLLVRKKTNHALLEIERAISMARPDQCWEWPFTINKYGYPHHGVYGRSFRTHRYVCFLVHGEPDPKSQDAAHSCGNRACINPHHLRWASRSANMADCVKHGTINNGSRNGKAKLDESRVLAIRAALAAQKETKVAIAKRFGVSPAMVASIETRRTWKHLA